MISIEKLQAKRTELRQQREQLIANANAVSGAIQLCEDLLIQAGNQSAVHPVDEPIPVIVDEPTIVEVG